MDAHYAPAGFAEPPAPPASAAAQPAAPAWAYEARVPAAASSPSCSGSSPSLKASYEDGHPSQSESDVLQRQTFTAPHQLPGYATTPQATGMHSSTATELFVPGPLQTTGTLPPPTLSAYQHPASFSNRNFATTSPLVLQDSSFNTTSNGILNPHDPLLQIKTSQGTVPTALAFERLGSSALSNSIPPQSSTYRSAQESAPHLLQPQFSLLPSTLGGAQQTPQAYSSALFTNSAASIERALLRECSVIKHHQRPSVTQSIQAQLTGSQHPLHSYLSSTSIGNFQETSRQSSLSCSSVRDSTQVSNGVLQQKTPQVSAELAQSYSSVIPSSGYLPSATKVDSCSTKQPLTSTTIPKPQSVIPPVQTLNYSKPLHNQSSVISGQAQIYSTAQLPSLLSVSQSQNYGLVQPHNVPSIVHSQVYRSSRVEKLPSLYKTLTFSGSSQPVTSENQTLSYSSNQQEVLSLVTNENYPAQTRDLSSVSESQNYSSGHSQGLSPVSQTQVSYSSQSQVLSVVSPSESYASGQSLTLSAPSLSYSSASRGQSLPISTPTPNYSSMHSSPNAQTQGSSPPQPQKFLPVVQSSFASSSRGQTLQSSIASPDSKSYAERKLDSNVYTSSKQDDFPMQKLQALQSQASLESSSQRLPDGEVNAQESVYKTSKADDRYSQSVTRNNSHLEDQVVGVALQGSKQEENMVGSMTQLNQQSGQPNTSVAPDLKKSTNLMQTPQIRLNTKDLNQQHSLMHKMHEAKVQQQHDQIISASSQIQIPNHALGHSHQALPNAPVLLDSACDLQILQQAGILQASLGQAKASLQVQRVQSPQQIVHPFLQMDGHIIQSNGEHPQQQLHSQNSDVMKLDLTEPTKPLQQLTTKGPFSETNPHDSKNQFVSLGSICFPEAMLLSDERNILSNVDDILAATAAACGVTPSEFSKSAANETMQDIESSDSKPHYQQSLDVRHVNSDFNSITATVGKPQSINDISLNGNQVSVNLSSVPTLQSETVLDQPHMETPSQNIPTKVPSAMVGLGQEIQEQSSDPFKKQLTINHESKEDREIAVDSALSNNRNQEFVSNSRGVSGETVVSESDFTLVGDDNGMLVNHRRSTLALLAMSQPGDTASSKTEDEKQDVTYFNLPKEKAKGKEQGKEEEDNQKQLKKSAQCKRQNPRGTDVYSPYTSPSSESCDEGFQHQEKMRQKIKEVEEKQPEVKTGFIASFLDFLKCGPKQQFSTLAVRVPNRTRRSGAQVTRTFCPPPFAKTSPAAHALLPSDTGGVSQSEKVDNELKNSEQLSSFSSDEEDPGTCGHDIYKNTSAPLTALDATSDKTKKTVSETLPVATPGASAETAGVAPIPSTVVGTVKQDLHLTSLAVSTVEHASSTEPPTAIELDSLPSDQLAKGQDTVAIEGFIDEENVESGGEGQYRERDEFVVKIEDIETFKEALNTGKEPPAIWKVQKALLQKFVPEIRDGQREFAATNSYLGYFGDAKTKYKRIYVKFIENANKKEYVRVCSKKPRNKPSQSIRNIPSKPSSISKTSDPPVSKTTTIKAPSTKPKAKQLKVKAEPPPKKRKKWKEEFSSSQSESSPEVRSSSSEDEGFEPAAPSVTRFLNTRAMKETFKSYMELLVSIALDPDTMQALEKSNDELLLPHMKKIDGMLNDNRKRLLGNLHLDQPFKNALESFPELTIITRDSKAKSGGSAISKIKMNGKAYNKKTLRTSKTTTKSAQEFAVDPEKIQLYSLYHSLHHYKYHVYLICKNEISSVQKKNEDLGQEEIVQLCMKNVKWVEDLFEKFGELLNHVQQKCP